MQVPVTKLYVKIVTNRLSANKFFLILASNYINDSIAFTFTKWSKKNILSKMSDALTLSLTEFIFIQDVTRP